MSANKLRTRKYTWALLLFISEKEEPDEESNDNEFSTAHYFTCSIACCNAYTTE